MLKEGDLHYYFCGKKKRKWKKCGGGELMKKGWKKSWRDEIKCDKHDKRKGKERISETYYLTFAA